MSLGYHDLADIRLRHALRASRLADVGALLEEVDELRGFLDAVGRDVGARRGADLAEVLDALQAQRDERDEALQDARAGGAFERGCHAVMAAFKAEPAVVDLFGSGTPLAHPAEFCSICSPGHADGYGFCERHGKKVREMWTETAGPTQTGLICFLVLGAPLFDLLAGAWRARPAPARAQARRRRAR